MKLNKRYILLINLFICLLLANPKSVNSDIKCKEVPFCSRNMSWEDQLPIYIVQKNSIKIGKNSVSGILQNMNKDYIENGNDLQFKLYIIKSGIFRFKIKAVDSKQFELKENDTTFEISSSLKRRNIKMTQKDTYLLIYYFSNTHNKDTKTKYELLLKYNPFYLEYRNNGKIIMKINNKNLFDMEFQNKNYSPNEKDSLTTIKLDISLPESNFLTGLPERAARLNLQDTTNEDYYHFYNKDEFKYREGTYEGLYGVIPYIMSYSYNENIISGIIWNNPTETFIGIKTDINETNTKNIIFLSEGGIFDFSILSDKNINHYYKKLNRYWGKISLPPIFSLGYHQSRFSYISLNDVEQVDNYFDEYNIPYDSIWLDIDYSNEKRYMTWNNNFEGIQNFLLTAEKKGRNVVVIIDPHVKNDRNYPLFNQASKKKFFIKNDNSDFVGKCWCDDASYLDFYNIKVREFWKELMKSSYDFFFDMPNIHIWNDMNEPSVFEISRGTIPKTATITYYNKTFEHRMAHNIYGQFMVQATYQGQKEKFPNQRPFILTRSFFLGIHKYAAIWTGDTISSFEYLALSVPMLLSFSISGVSFIGADVTGFAEKGNVDLYRRWYQAGIFYPFFRAHSHELTTRREIWLFPKNDFLNMKSCIITRYQILHYIYTMFYVNYKFGMPVIRPLFFEYNNEKVFDKFLNTEYFFGDTLLIRPVISRNEDSTNKVNVYLYENERWYDFYTFKEILNKGDVDYTITKDYIGVFMRGGKILPKQMRLRRSSKMMKNDPYTLIICLDQNDIATGQLYFDDEKSFNYVNNTYSLMNFNYAYDVFEFEWFFFRYSNVEFSIEKIVILGKKERPNKILLVDDKDKLIKELEGEFREIDKQIVIEVNNLNYLKVNSNNMKYKIKFQF